MKPLFPDAKTAHSKTIDVTDAKFVDVQDARPVVGLSNLVFDKPVVDSLPAVPEQPQTQLARIQPPRITEDEIDAIGAGGTVMADISRQVLAETRASDAGEIGKDLNKLVLVVKGFDPSSLEKKGLLARVFNAAVSAKEQMTAQYATAERQLEQIVSTVETRMEANRKRIGDCEDLYAKNMQTHENFEHELTAGSARLVQLKADREVQRSKASADSFDAQILRDHDRLIGRLDKKLHDLRGLMQLCKTKAVQIRMLQDGARGLSDAFNTVKNQTLPSFTDSFSMYLLADSQKQDRELVSTLAELNEQTIRRTADLMRENAIGIAQANERPVVSIETLTHVKTQLLESVQDVLKIEKEGRAKRDKERAEIERHEQELIVAFAPGQR